MVGGSSLDGLSDVETSLLVEELSPFGLLSCSPDVVASFCESVESSFTLSDELSSVTLEGASFVSCCLLSSTFSASVFSTSSCIDFSFGSSSLSSLVDYIIIQ